MAGADQSNASAIICSSVRVKHSSVKPIRAARRRNSSVLEIASPMGSMAGVFSVIYRWPQLNMMSCCSSWVVAGSTRSA
jgi:hypothetical protein